MSKGPVLQITLDDKKQLYVIDGDTIDYDGVRYRLAGYDAPESRTSFELEKRLARIMHQTHAQAA